jgi:hypothetical protein
MNYRPMHYKEWIDDTNSSVTGVVILGNEAMIDWVYDDKKNLGKATSKDGLNYKGTYSEPHNTSGDRGTFEFKLYALAHKGAALLLGKWYSAINGDEREFLLEVMPEEPHS